jgi:hypothetical protein
MARRSRYLRYWVSYIARSSLFDTCISITSISLCVISYELKPIYTDLRLLLHLLSVTAGVALFFSFQEIVDLNAVNVAMSDSKSQQRSMLWRELIEEYLVGLKTPYRCVTQQNLVGVLMFVYVKTKHCDSAVKNVQVS